MRRRHRTRTPSLESSSSVGLSPRVSGFGSGPGWLDPSFAALSRFCRRRRRTEGRPPVKEDAERDVRARSSPVSAPLPATGSTGRERLESTADERDESPRDAPTRPSRIVRADDLFADPRTGVALAVSQSRNVRSRCRCSVCPAIHINSRSWLRSSSTHEPSDPPHRVVSDF